MLRKIECFIRPQALDDLKNELIQEGVDGMSVQDVRGFGRQRGHGENEKPNADVKFLPKTKVEIVVEEDIVERIVSVITSLARTGKVGDGKIFVLPVEDAVRIGSGEVGRSAVT